MTVDGMVAGILAGVKEGASDLFEAAKPTPEDLSTLEEIARDSAREALGARIALEPEARDRHLRNLEHLRSQIEMRLATIGVRAEREGREKLFRVVRSVIGAVTSMVVGR